MIAHAFSSSLASSTASAGAARPKLYAAPPQGIETVPRHVGPGLQLLLQAHEYALDVVRDPWEFAVELGDLQRAGLSTADCRWLVCKGWAKLAHELKPSPGESRKFRHSVGLAITRRSCFTLTDEGVSAARVALQLAAEPRDHSVTPGDAAPNRLVPCWDRDCRELRLAGRLVKQFKLPSSNQERILIALDEEGWPPRIDDPLPHSQTVDAKQRLHDAVKNLNRNQVHRLIRFFGDGTGQGVRWELLAEASLPKGTAAASTHRAG